MSSQLAFQITVCVATGFVLLSALLAFILFKSRKHFLETAEDREDRIEVLETFRTLAGKAQHLNLLGHPFLSFIDCSIFAEADEFGLKCSIKPNKVDDYRRDLKLKLYLGHEEVYVRRLGYDTAHESIQEIIAEGVADLLKTVEVRKTNLQYLAAIRHRLEDKKDEAKSPES